MTSVKTEFGPLEVMTLDEFIAMVISQQSASETYVNSTNVVTHINQGHGSFVQKEYPLEPITNDNLRQQFFASTNTFVPVGDTVQDQFNNVVIECLENFGLATHALTVDNDTLAVVCREDFAFRKVDPKNDLGVLICYAPRRNLRVTFQV